MTDKKKHVDTQSVRCVLYRQRQDALTAEDLDALVERLQGAAYRARCVRDWSECLTAPSDERVDIWLEDLNRLVREAHEMLDDVHLG